MLPMVWRLAGSDLPCRLESVTLVHLSCGVLAVRGRDLDLRLQPGELLAVRGEPVEILGGGDVAEALAIEASPAWVDRMRALLGTAEAPAGACGIAREPSGTETSRRAGRLLMSAYLERAECPEAGTPEEPGISGAGRLIELVGIALSIQGSPEAERRPAGARNRSRRAHLVRALEELEGAPLDGLSLRVLAERLDVSERQVSRLLRDELGRSFPDYIAALRIERAKKLLATTSESVTDVALETGWQSISHFNAVFRRRVGVTPSHYRARQIGETPVRTAS